MEYRQPHCGGYCPGWRHKDRVHCWTPRLSLQGTGTRRHDRHGDFCRFQPETLERSVERGQIYYLLQGLTPGGASMAVHLKNRGRENRRARVKQVQAAPADSLAGELRDQSMDQYIVYGASH